MLKTKDKAERTIKSVLQSWGLDFTSPTIDEAIDQILSIPEIANGLMVYECYLKTLENSLGGKEA